jgi:hypothetical protein
MRNLTLKNLLIIDEPLVQQMAGSLGRFDDKYVYADFMDAKCIQYLPHQTGSTMEKKSFSIVKTEEFGLLAIFDRGDLGV